MNSIAEIQPRDMYYGSADIASILGLEGAFGSQYSVFDRKVNGYDDAPNDFMIWGSRLEDDILEAYGEQEGAGEIIAMQAHYACAEWPKARATLDAVALVAGERVAVEAKSSGDWSWEEVPLPYEAQVQWQLGCAGLKRAHLVVFFRNTCQTKLFSIDFNPVVFQQMLTIVRQFDENHVLTGIPPAVDGHSATTEALKRIRGDGSSVDVAAIKADLDALAMAKEAKKAIEAQEEEIENRIKAALGSAETGTIEGQVVVTWAQRTRTNFDSKAFKSEHPELAAKYTSTSDYRALNLKKPKKEKS